MHPDESGNAGLGWRQPSDAIGADLPGVRYAASSSSTQPKLRLEDFFSALARRSAAS
jgi:hypothetical protein